MKCLDSSFLVDILRGLEETKRIYTKIKGERLVVPAVVAFELYRGLSWSRNVNVEEALIEKELSQVDVVPFTIDGARIAGLVSRQIHQRGSPISPVDAMVAATAMTAGCELVTRDKGFKDVKGLKLILY